MQSKSAASILTRRLPLVKKVGRWGLGIATMAVFVHQNIGDVSWCVGPSMLPTFNCFGDLVIYERLSVSKIPFIGKGHLPNRGIQLGEVVVAVSPIDPSKLVCKRVVGLPGDNIVMDPTKPNSERIIIPEGHVWLQGDNLNNSRDSRDYGPVPLALILGKIFCKVFPQMAWVSRTVQPVQKPDWYRPGGRQQALRPDSTHMVSDTKNQTEEKRIE